MTATMETRKAAIHTVLENAETLSATTVNWIQEHVATDQHINYTPGEIKTGLAHLVNDGFVNVNKTLHRTYYHIA